MTDNKIVQTTDQLLQMIIDDLREIRKGQADLRDKVSYMRGQAWAGAALVAALISWLVPKIGGGE